MATTIEVLFSPAEYEARRKGGFAGCTCVVFDVLRATSVMITGLANGATGFIPAAEISQAIALHQTMPHALLAGERNGLRIRAAQSGGVDFDLGNSPREYTPERVRGRTIISTTTNGTRAFRACASAAAVTGAAFLNLTATVNWLTHQSSDKLVLVCAGTGEWCALEDTLCAGALCDLLDGFELTDSAIIARGIFRHARKDLRSAVAASRNAQRLLANPDLEQDVAFCLQQDAFPLVAVRDCDGVIRKST